MHVYREQMGPTHVHKILSPRDKYSRGNKAVENMTKREHKCEESDRATQKMLLKHKTTEKLELHTMTCRQQETFQSIFVTFLYPPMTWRTLNEYLLLIQEEQSVVKNI